MATDVRGLFQNNRRREAHAVTATIPSIIEQADLRSGTAAVTLASGDYTTLTIPANVIVTSVSLVVTDPLAGGTVSAGTLAAKIGGTSVLTATTITAAGLTAGTGFPLLVSGNGADLVVTAAVTGIPETGGGQVVVEYTDFDRATMSYIGEE